MKHAAMIPAPLGTLRIEGDAPSGGANLNGCWNPFRHDSGVVPQVIEHFDPVVVELRQAFEPI